MCLYRPPVSGTWPTMVPFELLIVHFRSFNSAEYPAMSHCDNDTRVKARSGQYSTSCSVMFCGPFSLGMDIHSSPIAVAVKRVWSVALICHGGICVSETKRWRAGDMWDDAPESYTLTSSSDRGLPLHESVAPANVVVKANTSPSAAILDESFPFFELFSLFPFQPFFFVLERHSAWMCPLYPHFQHSTSLLLSPEFPFLFRNFPR